MEIHSEEDFIKIYNKSSKDVYLAGLSEFEKMYEDSKNIYDFTKKLIEFLGIESPNEEQYKNAYVIAVMINSLINIVGSYTNTSMLSNEMMYI